MIIAGGANNTTYLNGERGFICQPAAQIPFWFLGGWGALYPTTYQGTQTPCQRSAVPSPARNARQFPLHPRSINIPPQRGCNRMGGPWENSPRQILHDMGRPCVPDRPPWFGHVFRVPPATVPPITSKIIYINARASAARFTHKVSKQGSSPARPRPLQVVEMRDGFPQGRGGAGDWCSGWPRPFRAGCGVPGGGAARCPRA